MKSFPSRTRAGKGGKRQHAWGNDNHTKAAKAQGLRARSAFKLRELQAQLKLMRAGDKVVDLGAAPGGFSLVANEIVGERGLVVALDKQPIAPILGVTCLCLDLMEDSSESAPSTLSVLLKELNGPANVVLSDLAPALSGIKARDQANAVDLHQRVVELMDAGLLKRGGKTLIKVFSGEDAEQTTSLMKARFGEVRMKRSTVSRTRSSEYYLAGSRFRGTAVDIQEAES